MFKRIKRKDKDKSIHKDVIIEEDMVIETDVSQSNAGFDNTEDRDNHIETHAGPLSGEHKDEEYVLYAIIDKNMPGILNYMRESGLNISKIFYSVTDIRNTILMQSSPTRVIFIETGMGVFTATKVRQEIIDTLSLSDDDSKITVFYTSSVLKMDAVKTVGKSKNIEWVPFKSMVDVISNILIYGETYVLDEDSDDELVLSKNDILNYKGKTDDTVDLYSERMELNSITREIVESKVLDGDSSLQKYKPHI